MRLRIAHTTAYRYNPPATGVIQILRMTPGDLLRLPWSAYDGKHIRLRQSKGGRRLKIPVGAPLRAQLEAMPRVSPTMLTNSYGAPWTSDGFRTSWGKACANAGTERARHSFHGDISHRGIFYIPRRVRGISGACSGIGSTNR